jgi:hypothetical protein
MESNIENFQTFVVFTMDGDIQRWWQPLLKKPFHHCLIIYTWEENGKHFAWVRDPIVFLSKWKVRYARTEPFEIVNWWSYLKTYRDFCVEKFNLVAPKIVKIEMFLDKYKFIHKLNRHVPLCTMYIKDALGIANLTAVTPRQLYNLLRKKYNCKCIFI